MAGQGLRRGRKPSIAVATAQVIDLGRTVRTLATDLRRLQTRLRFLDAYYSSQSKAAASTTRTSRRSRRGPNVRDLAHDVLKKTRKALPIQELARRVTRARGGRAGKQFAQNLGIALGKDRRFKRVERGVYGLR
jgi:hypothetical protein